MLNAAAITTALTALVGFRPLVEGNPAGNFNLPTALLTSSSGLYVQDGSELLTSQVLRGLVPSGLPAATWLQRLQTDALTRFTTSLVAGQGLAAPVLLPETTLVKNPGQRANVVNKLSRFVGLQLRPLKRRGVAFGLPSLSLQLDGPLVKPLLLYVYVDSQPDPLYTIEVDTNGKPNFPLLVPLQNIDLSAAADASSTVWLGYYEDDLPLATHAIYAEVGPCGCVNDPFTQWSQHLSAMGFSVPAADLPTDRTLFDPARVGYESGNFGLNLTFYASCNLVTTLTSPDNVLRVAPLVQQALALRLYEALASTPNLSQLTGRQDVQADALHALYTTQAKLYGGKVPGTEAVYPSGLAALTLDMSGLDVKCQKQTPSLLSVGSLTR